MERATMRELRLLGLSLLSLSCATLPKQVHSASRVESPAPLSLRPNAGEHHLASLRQMTFRGENAEAYWSHDGRQLSLQVRTADMGCDRIFRMDAQTGALAQVSSGKGATTCAFFLPGDQALLYASTHEAGDACPPKPDMSQGYVWALYDSYDLYKANADGTGVTPLTRTPGYDAEATVCPVDGSIVFTSTRDGDVELYRMDRDGQNVRRLTSTPGYDGGAVFNRDCSKIAWRASRPRAGKALDDYRALLAKGLVRPSKLELFVANADGSEARQVTYLDAASFAPAWHPTKDRLLFSSNFGDPKGREFDLFAVNADGTGLERITHSPGFDGFPLFSPDGTKLAFSSNRATAPGQTDTNVFIAEWKEDAPEGEPGELDRVKADVAWLAAPEREGRGVGTKGLEDSARWLAERFAALGLSPAGDNGTFLHAFPVVTSLSLGKGAALVVDGKTLSKEAWTPLGFSTDAELSGELAFVGYGIRAPELGVDDYAKAPSVKGRIAVVRRFTPSNGRFESPDNQRRYGDLRYKAWAAREAGAKGLLVVDWPEEKELPPEAKLPSLRPEGAQDAGLPVVAVKRDALGALLEAMRGGKKPKVKLSFRLEKGTTQACNVVGRLSASSPEARPLPSGAVVLGAHYDHLGFGGRSSLAPDSTAPHLGADDNASGVAGILEAARLLVAERTRLRRDVVVTAFSGEELGTLGSSAFTRAPPAGLSLKDVVAMVNLDMVGRMRSNRLAVLGVESSPSWRAWLEEACLGSRVECEGSGDGYGPSDHTPFYAAGVPVVHLFTGAHSDYHKPSDSADRVNVAGVARSAQVAAVLVRAAASTEVRPEWRSAPQPAPAGDMRSFNASLGTVPDYAPPAGTKGVLLAGVRAGGAAEAAGMRRGDVLVKLGTFDISSIEDLMFALNASKPGETVTAVVLREGARVELKATFQEAKRR
jgi:Tol biopolymer transport system component/Iap family predicted aminopeptidase